MRALLEDAERRVEKGQLYTAYQRFRSMKHCAYMGAEALSRSTLKAAMDWGHAFSIRDKDGKHTGYGIMGD